MMSDKMLKFIKVEREMPAKRPADTRREDFTEIYGDYLKDKAQEQSSRCSQCGVPFCQNACPLQNNIPDWLMLTAEGRTQDAYRVSAETNSMPEICGRICPQDRLCEGSCVIEQSTHGTVTIGAVERYLTDTAWDEGWVEPLKPRTELPLSVGIIGAGPAGLAAAESLREQGWQVTVYDRYDRAGGLLIYGIPNFKLEKDIVERRTKRLEDGGIKFVLNTDIGKDISFEDLQKKHASILIATGVYNARCLEVPGSGS
ncbi:MAG: NAD(P)-dependent oxidoreductase, partial [Acidimicrobiales bacterium]